ncbi:MAG: CAAX prenyl protease-related protein [Verrucomicrobia bacterium]|nr:CAAX prenyl protease-related protein [Verrucomicrobiota bacterium]
MNFLNGKLAISPLLARVVPFAVFIGLTVLQEQLGETARYWIYLAKTLAGAWMIWLVRPFVAEMKWAMSWAAVAAGVAVFALWVGLDPLYPHFGKSGPGWNPHSVFGVDSTLAWFFIAIRLAGSAIVVPPLEEVFYRSCVYRYLAEKDFLSVPLNRFLPLPFVVTSVAFGFEHAQWLAGILCGFIYQGLVCRTGRLGDAILAHAITNFLLGLWVIWKGAWQFW